MLSSANVRSLRLLQSNRLNAALIKRSVFSHEYLGGEDFTRQRRFYLQETPESECHLLRRRIIDESTDCAAMLLSDDVKKLIYSTKTADDLTDTSLVLKSYVDRLPGLRPATKSVFKLNRGLTRLFLLVCREIGAHDAARRLIRDDPGFARNLNLEDQESSKLLLTYFQILYDKELYSEV